MAEEYDDRFKSEMTRMMETVILKLGEHDKRFDSIEQKVDENTGETVSTKKEVKILQGQFTDVVKMVLEDNQRITKLETEVEDLKGSIH